MHYWLHGEENNALNPLDWGCKLENLFTMTKDPAPESIMKMIFCSCAKGCGTACGCRKHGVSCTIACKVCIDTNCTNNETLLNAVVVVDLVMEYNSDHDDEVQNELEA